MDFKKNIPEIEKKIHYIFKDKSLLTQAFTRSSFCNEHRSVGKRGYISNEVLEFFGDSVLSTAIISMMLKEKTERYAYGIYTDLNEGDFSNIRSKLSDKRNLSKSMEALGLQKYLRMGDGDAKLGIENEPSVMEDLFESIVGAVYIDCGMDISRVIKLVSDILDVNVYFSADVAPIQSYKNALQEWCADKKHRLPAPVYKTISVSGPDHKRVYERAVIIGDRTVAVGKGKNQKLADTAAAEAALEILKKETTKTIEINFESLTALKNLAAKSKQPSPEFRDLGETPKSNENCREYIIECRCMGKSDSAVGKSKQEARVLAAEKVLAQLLPKNEEKQTKTSKKKSAKEKKPKASSKKGINTEKPKVAANKKSTAEEKVKALSAKKAIPKNAKKSDKSPSPKKQPHQHKKHL